MSILTAVCLVAFGFGIGGAVGATVQKSADKKDCNACWSDMYSRAWTITLDGEQYKMFPLWEPGKGDSKRANFSFCTAGNGISSKPMTLTVFFPSFGNTPN